MQRKVIDLKTIEGRNKFYQSKEWRALRAYKLTLNPFCEVCAELVPAVDVHHKIDIKVEPTRCMDINNLQSLCKSCHSTITSTVKRTYEIVNKKWNFDLN